MDNNCLFKRDDMTNEEYHEYLCSILAKLVDSDLTTLELLDVASALGIKVAEFYSPKEMEA
jgi:hypothetical protein